MKQSSTIYNVCVVGTGAAGGAITHTQQRIGAAAAHFVGACKLGNDPKTSALTPFLQSHDVDNL